MAEFGGSATEKRTAATTTTMTPDSEKYVAVTFRESGRIVVGKKGIGFENNRTLHYAATRFN